MGIIKHSGSETPSFFRDGMAFIFDEEAHNQINISLRRCGVVRACVCVCVCVGGGGGGGLSHVAAIHP